MLDDELGGRADTILAKVTGEAIAEIPIRQRVRRGERGRLGGGDSALSWGRSSGQSGAAYIDNQGNDVAW
jgi:hypothetical protein